MKNRFRSTQLIIRICKRVSTPPSPRRHHCHHSSRWLSLPFFIFTLSLSPSFFHCLYYTARLFPHIFICIWNFVSFALAAYVWQACYVLCICANNIATLTFFQVFFFFLCLFVFLLVLSLFVVIVIVFCYSPPISPCCTILLFHSVYICYFVFFCRWISLFRVHPTQFSFASLQISLVHI